MTQHTIPSQAPDQTPFCRIVNPAPLTRGEIARMAAAGEDLSTLGAIRRATLPASR